MENTNDFIQCYNELDDWMRERYEEDDGKRLSHGKLLRIAAERDSAVKTHLSLLYSFSHLRNAIVHDAGYPKHVIATPNPSTVSEFKRICSEIMSPDKALKYASTELEVFDHSSLFVNASELMRRNDYSQIVVKKEDDSYGILSREGVSRWVENNMRNGFIHLKNIKIQDVAAFEDPNTVKFACAQTTIYDAMESFAEVTPRIHTMIITNHGSDSEKPLGILTVWDIQQRSRK